MKGLSKNIVFIFEIIDVLSLSLHTANIVLYNKITIGHPIYVVTKPSRHQKDKI